jgi:hypothetical protein
LADPASEYLVVTLDDQPLEPVPDTRLATYELPADGGTLAWHTTANLGFAWWELVIGILLILAAAPASRSAMRHAMVNARRAA